MPGEVHQSAGGDRRQPATVAIGKGLAEMYDSFLRAPLPDRLTVLLGKLDERDRGPTAAEPRKPAGKRARQRRTAAS
jgi:Anti-sigma factor NepR